MNDKVDYKKKPLSLDKQIKLLQERGLIVDDIDKAKSFLSNVSYYRFSAYTLPLEEKDASNIRSHKFRADTTFARVVSLYEHDSKIRAALFSVLSDTEILFKSKIAHYLTTKYDDPFIHYDSSIINSHKLIEHASWITKLETEIQRTKETFIEHYKNKYKDFPKLPLWMSIEAMSMGALSKFYSILSNDIQKDIFVATFTGNISYRVFASWLHSISYTRNLCAHHCRIFNRVFAIKPKIPNIIDTSTNNDRLGHFCSVLEYIIKETDMDASNMKFLNTQIKDLIQDEPWLKNSMGYNKLT